MRPVDRIRGASSRKLEGKTIVLGVTGSIAAVKTVELARELVRHGAEVYAVMTRSAVSILHPNALQFATGHPVVTEIDGSMDYLAMCGRGGKADLLLIAPSTSNTIGKIANGIDDSTVTTYAVNALGAGIPIVLAPAAHETMIDNPAVAANLRRLQEFGIEVVEPKRAEDQAKLADVEAIVSHVLRRLGLQELKGQRVLVITGGTVEPIDDVRVVTNRSTGATGMELAKAAFENGADIELWVGRHEVEVPGWIPSKTFETTESLEAMALEAKADVCLVPAAIADYAPTKKPGKISSRDGPIRLDLSPTPKVLVTLRKITKGPPVGFKAEASADAAGLKAKAMALMKEAELDFVVANDVSQVRRDVTAITIFDRKGQSTSFEGSKSLAAERIWRAVLHGVPR